MMGDTRSLTFGEDALVYESALSTIHESSNKNEDIVERQRNGRRISWLNPLTWFQSEKPADQNEDDEPTNLVKDIMEAFRNGNIEKMESFLEKTNQTKLEYEDDSVENRFIDDDYLYEWRPTDVSFRGNTFVVKHKLSKSVRFELDTTPVERVKRPFTPLVTSTPRLEEVEEGEASSSFVEVKNRTSADLSSIQYRNESITSFLNKSRQDAVNLATDNKRAKQYYRVYYDDTDEEEVEEEESDKAKNAEILVNDIMDSFRSNDVDRLSTFIVKHAGQGDDREEENMDVQDVSMDSSVYMGFERIDGYIKALEDEINLSKNSPKYRNEENAEIAQRRLESIEQHLVKLHNTVDDLKKSFSGYNADKSSSILSELISRTIDLDNSSGDTPMEFHDYSEDKEASNAFEDSNWNLEKVSNLYAKLDISTSLVSMDNLV